MSRFKSIEPEKAEGKAKELLSGVQAKLGKVPNIFKLMANSPAVLESYLNFSGAMGNTTIDAKLREQIALTVSQTNSCEYCLAAHTAIGKMVGLTDQQVLDSRNTTSGDAKAQAALNFAKTMVEKKAVVSDGDVQAVKDAGLSDGEITEVIGTVVQTIFTNYFNHIADTEVDFPKAEPLAVG